MKLENEKFKVGWGNAALMLRVESREDPNIEFPDGCKPELSYEKGGLVLRLLNRNSGIRWSRKKTVGTNKLRNSWQLTLHAKSLNTDVDRFGSVSPDSVERVVGGFVLRLPTDRPPVKGKKSGVEKASMKLPSRQPEPVGETLSATPAPPPAADSELQQAAALSTEAQQALTEAQPAPLYPSRVTQVTEDGFRKPGADLLAAVDAVNQWKDFLGEKLAVTLSPSGKLAIMVEYGEP